MSNWHGENDSNSHESYHIPYSPNADSRNYGSEFVPNYHINAPCIKEKPIQPKAVPDYHVAKRPKKR